MVSALAKQYRVFLSYLSFSCGNEYQRVAMSTDRFYWKNYHCPFLRVHNTEILYGLLKILSRPGPGNCAWEYLSEKDKTSGQLKMHKNGAGVIAQRQGACLTHM